MGLDDIVCEFALCTLKLHFQPTKSERVLKSKLWKEIVYICLIFVQDKNQEMLMQWKRF